MLGSKTKVKDTTIALVFVQEEIDEELSIELNFPVLLLFLTLPTIALLHQATAVPEDSGWIEDEQHLLASWCPVSLFVFVKA